MRNALRYLSIKSNITAWSWKKFMEYPLTPALTNEYTVKFFTQQCSAEFTKRWCQPLCKSLKQMRAWETLIPSVVSRHYEAVVAQGVGYEGSTWRGGTEQSWRWMRIVTRPGQHNLIVHRHDTIFKAHYVQIQQNALWIFECRCGGSDGPRKMWVMTDYSAIIHRVMVWMGAMPRWNHIASTTAKAYVPRRRPETRTTNDSICTPCTLVFSRSHTSTRGTEVKHSGRVVRSYDPFGDVVVISYRPQGSDPSDNFVCVHGKFKLPKRFVEP